MREMKDSGIEWIGAIPQDWKTDRLQWHLKEINVSNNPIQTKNILSLTIEAGVIPYAEKGNQGNKAKEDYSQYKIALPDMINQNRLKRIFPISDTMCRNSFFRLKHNTILRYFQTRN